MNPWETMIAYKYNETVFALMTGNWPSITRNRFAT